MNISTRFENGDSDISVEKSIEKFKTAEKFDEGIFKLNHRFFRKFCSRLCYLGILLLFIFFLLLFFPKPVTVNHYYASSMNQTTSTLHPIFSKSNLTSTSTISLETTPFSPLQFSQEDLNNKSPHNCKLFIIDNNQIRIYDLKTNKSSLYHEVSQDITSFDVINSTIFFTEKNIPLIQSLNSSHNNVTISSHLKPKSMAIDYLTKKFYILDKSAGTINVMDFEGKYYGVILSGFEELHDIVLDVEEGYMFILQNQKSILRINLDGSNVEEIVKDNVTAMTIDRERKQIFWSTRPYSQIHKADYNGKRHITMSEISPSYTDNLAFYKNQIFGTIANNLSSSDRSLWSCDYSHEFFINRKIFNMYYNNITSLRIFADWDSDEYQIDNPCLVNNGNCSHLCLLSSNRRRTCACSMGYQLDLDLQSCKLDARDFILYSTSQYLRAIAINTTDHATFRDVIIPNPDGKDLTYFDYDVELDNFYYQNNSAVKVMHIKKESEAKTVILNKTTRIAIDTASKNLYYVDQNKNIWLYHNNLKQKITNGKSITDFILDASGGRLYFISYSNSLYYSSNLDGSRLEKISRSFLYDPRLVFDYDLNKTYYVSLTNDDMYAIIRSNQNYLPAVTDMTEGHPYVPSFYGEYLYVRNYTGIWRVNKSNTAEVTLVASNFGLEKIYQLKVFRKGIDFSNGKNSECAINNGGCEHFCFSKPTKYCGCADNYKLHGDNKCYISSL